MAKSKFPVGSQVVFLGYEEDTPEDARVLEAGETYTVFEDNPGDTSIAIQIDNPDFNPKKKVSDENSKQIIVDVFYEEVKAAPAKAAKAKAKAEEVEDEDEDEAEEAPAPKSKAKTKAAPKAEEAEDEDEDEDEDENEDEEAPAPKSKAKAKADPKAKAKAKAEEKPAPKAKAKAKAEGKTKLAKKAEPKAEEDDMTLENEDEEILELIDGAEDLLELAAELIEDSAALDYKMGGVLFHVRQSKAYQSVDKKYSENGGFALYVQECLNIDYRKAMYLIDIYYKFNKYGIDAAKVQELGWTKCSKIAAVMTEKNAEDLVELAESSSVSELTDSIKETYSTTGGTKGEAGEKRKRVTFKFRLLDEAGTSVTKVIEAAKADLGLKDDSDVFEHIMMEWAVEHGISIKSGGKAKAAKAKAKADEAEDEEAPAPKAKAKAKARAA